MGHDQSLVEMNIEDGYLDLSNKGLKSLPHLPINAMVSSLDLSRNRVNELSLDFSQLKYLVLQDNCLSKISSKMINSLLTCQCLTFLDLSNNELTKIPKRLLEHPSIRVLYAFSNKIVMYPASNNQITQLDLGNNQLEVIPILSNSISVLNIDENQIVAVQNGYGTLTKLCICRNLVNYLNGNMKFSSLQIIDLSRNRLSDLPNLRHVFPRAKKIDLSYNLLSVFPVLPRQLSFLSLNNNLISRVPSDIKKNTCLAYLDISNNLITNVPTLPPSLHTLIMNNNIIETIEGSSVSELSTLSVHCNMLTEFPKLLFSLPTNLKLSYNMIKNVKVSYIPQNVTYIDFSFNKIETIPDSFFSLPCLISVNLAYNNLKFLPKTFSSSKIIFFNGSGNSFDTLPEMPTHLEVLILSDCNLKTIDISLFPINEVSHLDLSNNQLKRIPLFPNLINLSLSNNQLDEFPIIPETIQSFDLTSNNIISIPAHLVLSNLTWASFAYNFIMDLPTNFLAGRLRSLFLHGNPCRGTLELPYFPNIRRVSFTNPDVVIDIPNGGEQTLIVESNITIKESFTFSQFIGYNLILEDSLIFNPYVSHNKHFFGITNNASSHFVSDFVTLKIISHFQKRSFNFSNLLINSCLDSVRKSLNKHSIFECPMISLLMIDGHELISANMGNCSTIIVSDNNEVTMLSQTNENNIPSHSRNYPIIIENECAHTQIADHIVFNKKQCFDIHRKALNNSDRYALLASKPIINVLSKDLLLRECSKDRPLHSLLSSLRNIASSLNFNKTLTLVLIDLKSVI